MSGKILDGKAVAAKIRGEIKLQVDTLQPKPGLGVIMVGDDPASEIYVRGKERACAEVGMISKKIVLDKSVTELEVLQKVDDFNQDPSIHGFIVQLPLPEHIDENLVIESILPLKDADGFSPINLGKMLIGQNQIVPATPKGIMRLLDEYKVDFEGKHAVVIGRSNIVGKPISILLQQKHATVTMCHSKTKDLKDIAKQADILIVSVGKAKIVQKDMVKHGAIIVDVGMNRLEDGTLCGDVDFDDVAAIVKHITPVPGGVGPLTIAMLIQNTLECYNMQKMVKP